MCPASIVLTHCYKWPQEAGLGMVLTRYVSVSLDIAMWEGVCPV